MRASSGAGSPSLDRTRAPTRPHPKPAHESAPKLAAQRGINRERSAHSHEPRDRRGESRARSPRARGHRQPPLCAHPAGPFSSAFAPSRPTYRRTRSLRPRRCRRAVRLSAQPGWTALRGTGDPRNRDAFGTRCTPHARRLPSVWRTHAALSLDVCLVASGYPQAHQAGPDNLHADGALGEGSQRPPRPVPLAPAAGRASSAQRPMTARSPPLASRWQPSLSAKRSRGSAVPPAGLHSQVHGRLATDRLGALTLRTGRDDSNGSVRAR